MKLNVSSVVKNGLCTSCGICAGACKHGSIAFKYGRERNVPVVDANACVNCGLCYDVCPGKGVQLLHLAEDLYSKEEGIKNNGCAGYYKNTYIGHSTNERIRLHSATGGMVTQFLTWLLNKKIIDGAVVVRYKENNPFEPEPFIAKTEQELWDSRSSKYVVLSMDQISSQIADGDYKKIVVVGLPCQIQGWRHLARKNKKVRDAIIGYFAIYCSVNKTKHSTDYYLKRYKVAKSEVRRFAFRDDGCMGFMKFEGKGGSTIKRIPYMNFWFGTHSFFANPRCSLCIDQLGELADVSFGDIHIKPYSDDTVGTNSIITRSAAWDALLNQCKEEGAVYLEPIPVETLVSSQTYTKTFKKGAGVKTNMILRRLLGKQNPEYDFSYKGKVSVKNFISEISKAIMRQIGSQRSLWRIVILFDRNKD